MTLLTVVTIILIALGITAFVVLRTLTEDENIGMSSFESKLEQYRNIGGTYPSTSQGLRALFKKPTSAPRPRRWIQTLQEPPIDQWGTPYAYQYPGSKNPSRPEVISAGPDQKFGTNDDMSSQD